jgi:2-C-methyl-D-erythritol 4-phosphate cytidylyltransferase
MAVLALIPAAGMGRRMGAAISKQYLTLHGRSILAHTLEIFENSPLIDAVVLVVPPEEQSFCEQDVVRAGGFTKVRCLVDGGAERQDSVRNGLAACQASEDDLILIHDAVRPLFDPTLIALLIRTAREVGGAVVGVPVKDTVKQVVGDRIEGTPDRNRLWLAQTPQVFPFAVIRSAHEQAFAEGFQGTDDASLVERLGQPVAIVQGDYRNLKMTTPEDLVVAEALLQNREKQS